MNWDSRRKKQMLLRNSFIRERGRCFYCDTALTYWGRRWVETGATPPPNSLTVDHIIPKSKGGHDWIGNVVACCRACNMRRGLRPAIDHLYECIAMKGGDAR